MRLGRIRLWLALYTIQSGFAILLKYTHTHISVYRDIEYEKRDVYVCAVCRKLLGGEGSVACAQWSGVNEGGQVVVPQLAPIIITRPGSQSPCLSCTKNLLSSSSVLLAAPSRIPQASLFYKSYEIHQSPKTPHFSALPPPLLYALLSQSHFDVLLKSGTIELKDYTQCFLAGNRWASI